jgi:hypothetical protein
MPTINHSDLITKGEFMKNFIISALAILSIQINLYAGELINRTTNESIKFEIVNTDEQNVKIIIDGINAGFPVKEIQLEYSEYIKNNFKDESELFVGAFEFVFYKFYCVHTQPLCKERHISQKMLALLFPIVNIPALAGASVDVIALPVTGTKKIIKKINSDIDLKVFVKAMLTDQIVTISNKRFNRIRTTLLNSI